MNPDGRLALGSELTMVVDCPPGSGTRTALLVTEVLPSASVIVTALKLMDDPPAPPVSPVLVEAEAETSRSVVEDKPGEAAWLEVEPPVVAVEAASEDLPVLEAMPSVGVVSSSVVIVVVLGAKVGFAADS